MNGIGHLDSQHFSGANMLHRSSNGVFVAENLPLNIRRVGYCGASLDLAKSTRTESTLRAEYVFLATHKKPPIEATILRIGRNSPASRDHIEDCR